MIELKWSKGEKFTKTNKTDKPILNNKNEIISNIPLRAEMTRNKEKFNINKYETFLQERPMLVQTYQNPFLTKKFSDVINDQEKFLIPKDSFLEKS